MPNPVWVASRPPALPPTIPSLLPTLRALDLATSPADIHWMNGFTWEPESCKFSGRGDPCENPIELTIDDRRDHITQQPFYVWTGDRCSTFAFESGDYVARATRQYAACLSAEIANELWTGDQAQLSGWGNQFLTAPGGVVLSAGTGLLPTDALGCLEEHLSDVTCSGTGMIHATRKVLTAWAAEGLVSRVDGVLRTVAGTVVISDPGYPGTPPDGTAPDPDVQWAYATTPVEAWSDDPRVVPPDIASATDRAANTIEYRVIGHAAYRWDGCAVGAVGIQVDDCLNITLGS